MLICEAYETEIFYIAKFAGNEGVVFHDNYVWIIISLWDASFKQSLMAIT